MGNGRKPDLDWWPLEPPEEPPKSVVIENCNVRAEGLLNLDLSEVQNAVIKGNVVRVDAREQIPVPPGPGDISSRVYSYLMNRGIDGAVSTHVADAVGYAVSDALMDWYNQWADV